MCKSRFLAIFFGMLLVLSNTSEARVCFLSGSDAFNCSSGTYDDYIKVSKCSGYELCQYPSKNPGKTCEEEDMTHYLPEDCCSNTSLYEGCPSPKECDGRKCETSIRGPIMHGRPVQWRDATFCEIGKCHCPARYKETCTGNGQIGAFLDGTPDEYGCEGDDGVIKYEACICGDEYAVCDPEARPSTDEDDICTDSNGVTKYRQCTCPDTTAKRPEGNNWVEDPVYCCEGYVKECKGHNADDAYLCTSVNEPVAQCGYMMNNGCYGNVKSFEYSTSDVNQWSTVHCEQGWGPDDTTNLYCGTNCTCTTGYFDYSTVCTAAGNDICSELGYTEDSCEGDSIACPYDASAKKCIEAACTYYTEAHCETSASKICTEDEYGCWNLTSCAEGYILRSNRCMPNPCVGYRLTSCPEGSLCGECPRGTSVRYKEVCSGSEYPYTTCPLGGICTSSCSYGDKTIYKLDSCENCFYSFPNPITGKTDCGRSLPYDSCPTSAESCTSCTYSGGTIYNVSTCKDAYYVSQTGQTRTCKIRPSIVYRHSESRNKVKCEIHDFPENVTKVTVLDADVGQYVDCTGTEYSYPDLGYTNLTFDRIVINGTCSIQGLSQTLKRMSYGEDINVTNTCSSVTIPGNEIVFKYHSEY